MRPMVCAPGCSAKTRFDVSATLEVIHADICQLSVDAIVNAANNSLLGGGGVDAAIHRAAGPDLLAFCRSLQGCRTGDAKVSPGFDLPATYIIHTVGPVWQGGNKGEAEQLASCYRRCIEEAEARAVRSLAFPAISCGVYGYPHEQACVLAVSTLRDVLQATSHLRRIMLVAFSPAMGAAWTAALS